MYRTNILRAAAIAAFGFAPGSPAFAQDHQAHHHHGHHHGHSQHAQDHTHSIPRGLQAPQGRHGIGHEHWHEQFYSKLIRKDTKTSCCNLTDCVPTQSRTSGTSYEVMVDGEWTMVPQERHPERHRSGWRRACVLSRSSRTGTTRRARCSAWCFRRRRDDVTARVKR